MPMEDKIVDAFKTYGSGVSGAKAAGLDQTYVTVMAKISSLEDEAKKRAKRFDVADNKLAFGADKLVPTELDKSWHELESAYTEFNANLKRFRGLLKAQVDKGAALPNNYKQHYLRPMDILLKELDGASNAMKLSLKATEAKVSKARGQLDSADKAKQRVLEDIHLRIRKGCDDAEANVKKYLLKPSEKTFMDAFSNGAAFRTLGTMNQMVKKIGEAHGSAPWYGKLIKMYGDVRPDGIKDVASKKDSSYWEGQYKKFARGGDWWNTPQARVEAQRLMTKELPKWRKFAADVKTLYKA